MIVGNEHVRDGAIEDEAQDWVLLLARDRSPEAEEACRVWRTVDPRHEEAFRTASRLWQIAGQTPSALAGGWRAEAASLRRSRWMPSPSHRRAGVGLALAASLVAALSLPIMLTNPDARIGTRIGEVREVKLADGSQVTVGADSTVEVDFDKGARRVVLDGGQAFFEVAHDNKRPFTVVAGDVEVQVTGTKFDVRRVGDAVQVAVLEGRVELRRRPLIGLLRAKTPERVLTAGKQSELQPDSSFAPSKEAAVPPGEWRGGRFYYLDAPLREVLADASRYSASPIRIADPSVGDMRVTISFETAAVGNLLGNLEEILPIDTHRQPDGSTLVAKR